MLVFMYVCMYMVSPAGSLFKGGRFPLLSLKSLATESSSLLAVDYCKECMYVCMYVCMYFYMIVRVGKKAYDLDINILMYVCMYVCMLK